MDTPRILVIDDDDNTVREITDSLNSEGFEVFTCGNGEEAMGKVKGIKPDIILLDLMLPDQSGFRIAKDIKSEPKMENIPIIAISLKKEDIDKHIAAKSGIAEYCEKPLDYNKLIFIIKDILKNRQG